MSTIVEVSLKMFLGMDVVLCQMKVLNLNFYVHKAPSKVEE